MERTTLTHPLVFIRANMMTSAASIINPIPRNDIHILVIESISSNACNLLPLTHSKRFILYHSGTSVTKKRASAAMQRKHHPYFGLIIDFIMLSR